MSPAKVRTILKRVEWQGQVHDNGPHQACPCCDGRRKEGHEPGCMLAAALNEIESCEECHGTGVVERSISNGPNYDQDAEMVCQCMNAGAHR